MTPFVLFMLVFHRQHIAGEGRMRIVGTLGWKVKILDPLIAVRVSGVATSFARRADPSYTRFALGELDERTLSSRCVF